MEIGIEASIQELIDTLIDGISELDDTRIYHAKLDKLAKSLLEDTGSEPAKYGCLLQFLTANHGPREPFSNEIWYYFVSGIMFVRMEDVDTIEDDMLALTDKLRTIFKSRPRGVNAKVALMRLTEIQKPIPSTLADSPFYFLPFMVTIYDK